MQKIQKLIPNAVKAVKEVLGTNIDSNFKGYISSFGGSLIQSGLLPTLAFYSAKGGAQKERTQIIVLLEKMLEVERLFENTIALANDRTKLKKRENDIKQALVALKLAMRPFIKSDQEVQKPKSNA